MNEAPIQGVYATAEPGNDIELHRGHSELDGETAGSIRLWMSMNRGLVIRWEATDHSRCLDLGQSALRINHLQLGAVELPVEVANSEGRGTCHGTELGLQDGLSRVVAHWVNLPLLFPSAPLAAGARWMVESCGWRFTLDSRPDHSEIVRSANERDVQFMFTHVGELRRADSAAFTGESAANVLFGWQLAMSFALGRWVAPALPVGFDRHGRRIWEQWAPWRCDTMRGYESWWDTHTADDLAQFLDLFMAAYLDPDQRPIVRHVAMHVITANHAGTTAEAKVMLAQAGLEYLAWVTLVLAGRVSKTAYGDMKAAARLRLLLDEAEIDLAVPAELDGLREVADERGIDGPGATAWVRNRLTHPKDADEPYRISGLVWQTAQLLLEYAELLLLHRLNYTGRYMRRYPPHRWAHTSEPVPWAAGAPF